MPQVSKTVKTKHTNYEEKKRKEKTTGEHMKNNLKFTF